MLKRKHLAVILLSFCTVIFSNCMIGYNIDDVRQQAMGTGEDCNVCGDWTVSVPAACEEKGVETRTCINRLCTTERTRPIPALGHYWEYDEQGILPTCIMAGSRKRICLTCELSETLDVIPALGHDFDDWEVITPATCLAEGTRTRNCTVCGEADPNTAILIDPDAHNFRWTMITHPTLFTEGVETRTCTHCSATDGTRSVSYMVRVDGGSFFFGRCPQQTPTGGTEVTVSSFYMGRYQITQGEWEAVMGMGSNPSHFTTPGHGNDAARLPVEMVSWYEILVFSNLLSEKRGFRPAYSIGGSTDPDDWGPVPTGGNNAIWDAVRIVDGSNGYRLPTEYQWEFAAKGGTRSRGFIYAGSNDPNEVAWFYGKTGLPTNDRTHEVGLLKPNELGLYDMSGNVREWCFDLRWDVLRGLRGGSFGDSDARSARQILVNPFVRWDQVGFRLVRPPN